MTYSRRDLSLMAMFAAAGIAAPTKDNTPLQSKVYADDQIPFEGDDKKKGKRFFYAPTHTGFNIETHETVLGPGIETHPPHKHEHEEIMFIVEGTAEALLSGKKQIVNAGSVIVFGSNQMHGLRNAGSTPLRYYVVELRGQEA